jgi:Carboxypeptidase regulatory-like domain/TonB dependent receptor
MSFKRKFAGAWILAAGMVLAIPAAAQVTGSLSGTIADPNGMAVVNVRVVLRLHDSDVEEAATTTTGTGAFFFPVLRPIFYDLRVEAPNFKTQTLTNVKVDPTTETSLPPLKLELGDVKTTVESAAPTQTLQTANGEVSSTLTHDQVSALPLFERDPLQPLGLLDTLPGVSTNGRTVTTINGQPVSFANITYDGINIQDNFIRSNSLDSGDVLLGLHTDQISEATIVTSNPGTIYSGGSSQVAFSTPSGTNSFTGSLYWLNTPGGINAQYFQDNANARPASIQINQPGVTVGGPLQKNKLFFFLNFESDLNRSTITARGLVPTSPIPAGVNGTVQQILNLIPIRPTGVFSGTQNNGDTTYIGLARFDYHPSSKHSFSFSTSMNESLQDDPGDSSPYTRQPDSSIHTVATFFSGSWTWTPTPHLTNEVRLGSSVYRADFQDSLRSKYPYILLFSDLSNYTQPLSGLDPQGRSDRVYNYQDNLTFVRGAHSFQAGFSLQQYREWEYGISLNPYSVGGGLPVSLSSVTYPTYDINSATGAVNLAFEPFSLTPSGYLGNTPPVTKPSANLVSGYFQDNWKVFQRLSINLGLRYDYLSPVEDTSGLAIVPVLTGGNAAAAVYNQNLPFNFVPKGQGLYNADRNNFAPYVGFAWQVGRSLPVVVRGAYGISYVNDDLLRNISTFAIQNPFQSFANAVLKTNATFPNVPAIPAPPMPSLSLPGLLQQYSPLGLAPPQIFGVDQNLRTPYVQQANLGVETRWKGLLMSVRYVGNRLTKGLLSVDRNQVTLSPQYLQYFAQNGSSLTNSLSLQPQEAGEAAKELQICGLVRTCTYPIGTFNFFGNPLAPNGISLLSNLGRSRYDSLQISVSRRVSPGLSLTANYVYSKTLSNIDNYGQGAVDPNLDVHNPSLDNAPSPFNLKHAFKSTATYDLPFDRGTSSAGMARKIFGGWSISGILIAQSGAPFSLLSGLGTFNTEANSGENTVSTNLTAGQIQQYFGIQKNPDGSVTYVNTPLTAGPSASQAFQEPGPGQVGNLQRRMFTGPSAYNLDLGIRKVIAVTERVRIELRAESINVFNHENWLVGDQTLCNPNLGGCSATAGQPPVFQPGNIFQWTPPRSFQFLLRLRF